MQTALAPIVLFAYARPDHTRRTLEALAQNPEAKDSVLYIFCDGPKDQASAETLANIQATREVAALKPWCGEVIIERSPTNKGLAQNIVEGVTRIVNQYGRVIVLEDDTEPCPFFLDYMNKALTVYADEPKVMHISGYVAPLPQPQDLPDTFLLELGTCWGWATWSRAWSLFSPDAGQLLKKVYANGRIHRFNLDGSYPFQTHLLDNVEGRLKTWNVKWQATLFLHKGLGLHPRTSLVTNIGIDGSGENCQFEEFYLGPLATQPVKVEAIVPAVENRAARKQYADFNRLHFHGVGPSIPQQHWGNFKRFLAKIKRQFFPR